MTKQMHALTGIFLCGRSGRSEHSCGSRSPGRRRQSRWEDVRRTTVMDPNRHERYWRHLSLWVLLPLLLVGLALLVLHP